MDLERMLLLLCVVRFGFDSSNTGLAYQMLSLYNSMQERENASCFLRECSESLSSVTAAVR